MEATVKQIPEGYMEDRVGRLIPLETISEIDRTRDSLVREIVVNSKRMSNLLNDFKLGLMGDIEAFAELSFERFGAKLGGTKGNITLTSFDGKFKVCRAINDQLVFDERLQVAKSLIDECIHGWSKGAAVEIMALVNDAFQVDKEGRVDTKRILSLRRLEIADDRWKRAMTAIGESLQVTGSKTYVRVYEQQEDGSYQMIALG
ncbi:MAG: sulfate transporter [Desulfobacteraceae bacterium 4572_35.1]|nr:MAG: sulfate transporter [Desulfobacteraceae bacterium 4572_35.1]